MANLVGTTIANPVDAARLARTDARIAEENKRFAPPQTPSAPVASPVITAKPAEADYANIQTKATEAQNAFTSQGAVNAQTQAQKRMEKDAADKIQREQNLEQQRIQNERMGIQAKSGTQTAPNLVGTTDVKNGVSVRVVDDQPFGDGYRKVSYDNGTYDIVSEGAGEDGTAEYVPLDRHNKTLVESQVNKAESERKAMESAERIQQQILDIQSGVVPLYPWQQAQVEGVANQFKKFIEQQQLSNISASGTANIRGYQKGSAEYDPTFQNNVIGNIVSAGANKLSDLAVQAASAVSQLTTALRSDNVKAVKDAYDVFEKAQKTYSDNLQTVIDDTSTAIKDAQTALTTAQADRDKIAVEAAKNGAPKDVVSAIASSGSVADAVNAAGDYLQGGTGIVGEYAVYKRDATSRGQVPMSFDDYQTRDANRKVSLAKATSASGLPLSTVTQIDKLSSSFDGSPITKQYNEIQNKKLSIDSILESGVKGPGDLAIVYEFMKALDPTSVVRETEYATAAKSGNIFSGIAAKYNGYMTEGGGFLPEAVKRDFKSLIDRKFKVAESQYENLRDETARKINIKTGMDDGLDYLTDYGKPSIGNEAIMEEEEAQNAVESGLGLIRATNPALHDTISQMYISVNPDTGKAYSAADILTAFPELKTN